MTGLALSVPELLFVIGVFIAILLLFTDYAAVVLAATLLAVIWQSVATLGASLFLAIMLVVLAAIVRFGISPSGDLLGGETGIGPLCARLLDDLLTQDDDPAHDHREVQRVQSPPERRNGGGANDERAP